MFCVLMGCGVCDCGVASLSCCCIVGELVSAILLLEVRVCIALLSWPLRAWIAAFFAFCCCVSCGGGEGCGVVFVDCRSSRCDCKMDGLPSINSVVRAMMRWSIAAGLELGRIFQSRAGRRKKSFQAFSEVGCGCWSTCPI